MKVTVIIPTYNRAAMLSGAIHSLLRQRRDADLDILVIDDGSTDGTAELLQTLAASHPQLRFLKQPTNLGVSQARNRGLAALLPETDVVTFLDSDDLSPPGRFAADLPLLINDPSLDLTYGRMMLVNASDIDPEALAPTAEARRLELVGIHLSAGLFRRSLIERIGNLCTDLIQAKDTDYLLRIFETGCRFTKTSTLCLYYLRHDSNTTNNNAEARRWFAAALIRSIQRRKANPSLVIRTPGFQIAAHQHSELDLMLAYTVVIPAFNAERTIEDCLASVLHQSRRPQQIIVVDDGSSDRTAALVAALASSPAAVPIHLLQQANQGPGRATSVGIRAAATPVVATLDADDLWLPEKMARQLAILESQPEVALVGAWSRQFQHNQPDEGTGECRPGLLRSTISFRRAVFEAVGEIVDLPGRCGEMVDWLARLQEQGHAIVELEEVLTLRRITPGSLTHNRQDAQGRGFLAVAHRALQRRRQAQLDPNPEAPADHGPER